MYIAHGPASYILNEVIQKKKISKLNDYEQMIVAILTILFGILPDIDIALLTMTSTPAFAHHSVFTHSILFYLFLWLLLNLLLFILKKITNDKGRKIFNDQLINVIQISFIISTMSHLLLDILFSYSSLFLPIKQQVTILGGIIKTNYFAGYIFTPTFACELIIIFLFILLIYKKYIKGKKVITDIIKTFIAISCIYLSFTIYMNLNTYNMSAYFVNGERIYDADCDAVLDSKDSDVDDDDIDNIQEADKGKISKFTKGISTNRYLAVATQEDIYSNIKYNFGAFNSYRVISQAYFEQNLAIEPVLKEYERRKYIAQTYSRHTPYPILLYEYFADNQSLHNLNTKEESGSIFFVTTNQKIENMGIILDSDTFVIVLNKDKKVVTHTRDEIKKEYPNCEIKVVSNW